MIKNYPDKNTDQEILFDKLWPKYPGLVNAKSVLQIGGRGASCLDSFRRLRSKGITYCGLLEVWELNIDKLKNQKSINEFICADVREIDTKVKGKFDVIFAWHILEHLNEHDFQSTIWKLCKKCNVLVVGLPWGVWEQSELYGNPYEKHLSHWSPEQLEELGFDMYTFGHKIDNHDVMVGILENKNASI